jgi:hypothetical protein
MNRSGLELKAMFQSELEGYLIPAVFVVATNALDKSFT